MLSPQEDFGEAPQVQQVSFQHRQKVLELCFWQNAAQTSGGSA